ncbi:ribonuclease P protein component [Flavobacterium rhizosphaerae]|uniref:Ribonuclease P protein component n=1 Tax=Flavobacterium rhizosphaerae TaxID=3163298 RepID=A0ABW8Z0V1_9FLAO
MMEKRFTYPKSEKLKSRVVIEKLFTGGKSVSKYPLRLVYIPLDDADIISSTQVGVSVSKRYFKKAVDRNYYKRLMREAYRLNKYQLTGALTKPYAFMLLYQTKDRLTYDEVYEKTVQLIDKFLLQEGLVNP